MLRFLQYFGQFQAFRGNLTRLPSWARFILFVLAVPGLVLLALSLFAVGVSILALLLLTVPAYRLLSGLAGQRVETTAESPGSMESIFSAMPEGLTGNPARRHVDVKIVEPQPRVNEAKVG